MHEVDPQPGGPRAEERLTEALRHLAASSRRGAPPEIAGGLVTAFRRYHTRRRRIRLAGAAAALAACLAVVAGVISMRTPVTNPGPEQAKASAGTVSGSGASAIETTHAAAAHPRPETTRTVPKAITARAATNRAPSRRQFIALPGYDPAVPADELHVVRVQLPASALWKMGAPVSPDSGARRVMADFVVSQDGTPYAMRLVQ